MQATTAAADTIVPQDADRFRVITLVASIYDVPPHEIVHETRGTARAASARAVAIYLAHTVLEMTFEDLGPAFGRHPTTASHAVRKVEAMRDDPKVDQTLSWLETVLRTAKEIAQ